MIAQNTKIQPLIEDLRRIVTGNFLSQRIINVGWWNVAWMKRGHSAFARFAGDAKVENNSQVKESYLFEL